MLTERWTRTKRSPIGGPTGATMSRAVVAHRVIREEERNDEPNYLRNER